MGTDEQHEAGTGGATRRRRDIAADPDRASSETTVDFDPEFGPHFAASARAPERKSHAGTDASAVKVKRAAPTIHINEQAEK